jgi:hypothetical protein
MQTQSVLSSTASFHGRAVFTKTAKGRNEVAQRSPGLSTRQRQVLILIDGVKQLHAIGKILPETEFGRIVDFLQQEEMITLRQSPSEMPGTTPKVLTDDRAQIAALKRLLSDTARNYLGLLSVDIERRVDEAQDAAQLLSVLGQWHMALRQSKHGGAYAGQYLAPIEAAFYGGTLPEWQY